MDAKHKKRGSNVKRFERKWKSWNFNQSDSFPSKERNISIFAKLKIAQKYCRNQSYRARHNFTIHYIALKI